MCANAVGEQTPKNVARRACVRAIARPSNYPGEGLFANIVGARQYSGATRSSVDLFIVTDRIGHVLAVSVGVLFASVALFLWYSLGMVVRSRRPSPPTRQSSMEKRKAFGIQIAPPRHPSASFACCVGRHRRPDGTGAHLFRRAPGERCIRRLSIG